MSKDCMHLPLKVYQAPVVAAKGTLKFEGLPSQAEIEHCTNQLLKPLNL